MSETPTDTPNRFPSLRGLEAVTLVSLVLNIVTVVVLIVALIGRHHPGGFRCHEDFHGGPGGGPGAFMHHPGFDGGPGPEHFGEDHGGGPGQDHFGPMDPEQFTDRVLEHLTRRFALTDAQKTQIRPLLEQQAQAFAKNHDQERNAREQAMDATRAKIRALLTPDQQKQFDQERAEYDHGFAHGPEQH